MARFQTDAGLMKCVVFLLREKFSIGLSRQSIESAPIVNVFRGSTI